MPTYFTSVPTNAALNALTVNLPLTQLDNTLVSMVSGPFTLPATWNVTGALGFGTASPLAKIHVGAGTVNNSSDAQILISNLVNDSVVGSGHAFSDSSQISRTGGISYNSYDARVNFIDATGATYGHYAGFQSASTISLTGTLGIFYDFVAIALQTSGTITNRYAYYVADMQKSGGTLTNQYGLYVKPLTEGVTNYAIYTEGTTPSVLGGALGVNGALQVNGNGVVGATGTIALMRVGNQTTNSTSSKLYQQGKSSGGTALEASWDLTVGGLYTLSSQSVASILSFNTTTGDVTLGEGIDFILGTATGTKLGSSTGAKLGFWGATPVVQQVMATGTGKTVDNLITMLQTLGLCKQS